VVIDEEQRFGVMAKGAIKKSIEAMLMC